MLVLSGTTTYPTMEDALKEVENLYATNKYSNDSFFVSEVKAEVSQKIKIDVRYEK